MTTGEYIAATIAIVMLGIPALFLWFLGMYSIGCSIKDWWETR